MDNKERLTIDGIAYDIICAIIGFCAVALICTASALDKVINHLKRK